MMKRSIEQEINKNIHFDVKTHSVKIYAESWIKDGAIIYSQLPEEMQRAISGIVEGYSKENPLYISRQDIFNEDDILLKFIKTLMFGYPKAEVSHFDKKGIQSSMHMILCSYPKMEDSLERLYKKSFSTQKEFTESPYIKTLCEIKGMGLSTLSKILYLFDVKEKDIPCIILDSRVKNSLKLFDETNHLYENYSKIDKSKLGDYWVIVDKLSEISYNYNIELDLLEYILFNAR